MKLSAKNVPHLTLPEGKLDVIYRDDELHGFGLRLRRTEKNDVSKTWTVQYRIGRKQRRVSLDVSKFDLAAARREAQKILAQVTLGQDFAAEREKKREKASTTKPTLAAIAARFIADKEGVVSPNHLASYKRHFERDFAKLMPRPIDEIGRVEINATLRDVIAETGRTAAARARSTLSTLYIWALKEGLVESSQNPVALTHDPLHGIDTSRDRVLSDAELVKVWNACGEDDFGRIVRLLILTGCRRDEIGSLKWSEIDLDAGTLTIAAERIKNRRAHTLTLPGTALDLLKSIPRRDGRDFVFGQRGGGYARWGWHTDAMRKRLGDMPAWRLHDLRRSAATGMAEIGIEPNIIEAILNHVSGHKGGVAGIYNRAKYAEPMRVALQRWADHVAGLLDGGRDHHNVVNLRRV